MGYYDDLLVKIEDLIENQEYDESLKLIDSELSMPYIPNDVEAKLIEFKKLIPSETSLKSLNDEDIIAYLKMDENHQLRAVDELDRRNLRDYVDLCNEYLKSKGFINAKVLLIDSLIKQEINEEFTLNNNDIEYTFIPRYVMSPEESLGYLKALELLNSYFMKEPSKLELAKQLLYKECLLALPLNFEEDEASNLSNKIIEYIEEAFS